MKFVAENFVKKHQRPNLGGVIYALLIALALSCGSKGGDAGGGSGGGGGGGATTADTTAPTVVSVTPANSATGITTAPSVSVTFSEAMNVSSVNGAFAVKTTDCSGATVSTGTPTTSDNITFTYAVTGLGTSAVYATCVTTGATDAAANALASAYSATWTTSAAPDVTPPTVSSTTPTNSATGISTSPSVSVTFSEAMNVASVNGAFTVKTPNCSGATVSTGTPTASGGNTIFTYSVTGLSNSTVYATCVTTGATDVAAISLVSAYSATWTTTASAAWTSIVNTTVGTGTTGNASGTAAPFGIVMDSSGNVYVHISTKIYRYTSAGAADTSWGTSGVSATVATAGTGATGGLAGTAIDSSNRVYIPGASSATARVQRLSADGLTATNIVTTTGDGGITKRAVAVNAAGNVLWLVNSVPEIRRYQDVAGTWYVSDGANGTTAWGPNSNGTLPGNVRNCTTVAASAVVNFASSNTTNLVGGNVMTVTGTGIPGGTTITSVDSATQITLSAAATGASGSGCTFSGGGVVTSNLITTSIRSIAVDADNILYVGVGSTTKSILKIAADGSSVSTLITCGAGTATNSCTWIAVNGGSSPNIYTSISNSSGTSGEVRIYNNAGALQNTFSNGVPSGAIMNTTGLLMSGVAVSSDGNTIWYSVPDGVTTAGTTATDYISKLVFQ